jgi:hypothetical protein
LFRFLIGAPCGFEREGDQSCECKGSGDEPQMRHSAACLTREG